MDRGWAIVTGATGGMGREYVRQLSARGHPLLVVARGGAGLEELRGKGVETLSADLATDAGVAAVIARASSLGPIDLLVNNAGLSTSGRFLDQSAEKELQLIRVNVEALYALTRAILPGMVARGSGGIIQVASVVGLQPIPYWTTYSATKAFVLAFGQGLAEELRGSGVRVVTVAPGFTKTGLYGESGLPGLGGQLLPQANPEDVVRVALSAFDRGSVLRIIGGSNRFLALAGALTPRSILRRLMGWMFAPVR